MSETRIVIGTHSDRRYQFCTEHNTGNENTSRFIDHTLHVSNIKINIFIKCRVYIEWIM